MNSTYRNVSSDAKYPFIANVLAIACDVPAKDVYVSQHLTLSEFLFTACMIVVALTAVSTFWSLLTKVEAFVVRKWKEKQRHKVAPTPKPTSNRNEKKSEADEIEKSKDDENREDEETETAVESSKDDAKATVEENVEDAFALEVELPFKAEEVEMPESEEKAEFVEMLMNVMHAGITIYLAINYWYVYLPDTKGKPFDRQLICRAAHLTVMPLFKPVSIAMWPALMPLLQFAHWQATRKKPLDQYQDRILPGTQPFAMNWISLIYAYLVGICWLVYMVATIVFLPLFLMSSWAILPVLWIMPFLFLHVPVQLLNGRALCCRCCLSCWRKDDLEKVDDVINDVAKNFKMTKEEVLNSVWDGGESKGSESIGMLTLKALTVLYMASFVSSLYFLSVYSGEIGMYEEMLNALRLDLDWQPTIQFAFTVDLNVVFAWPTDLRVEFQLPMFFSFTLVAFERLLAFLWLVNDYMKRFEINETSFRYAVWMVYAPYWLGEKFYITFEVGWECLVLAYAIVGSFFFACFGCCFKCFARFDRYPFGKEGELFQFQFFAFFVGLVGAVGKTGFYSVLKKLEDDDDFGLPEDDDDENNSYEY